jgi:tetratricopeptide (TPR) repeat protein
MTIRHDSAHQHVLAALRQAGEHPDPALLDAIRAQGPAVTPALMTLATDEQLLAGEDDRPETWAPLHAVRLLGEMDAVEAIAPLLPLFERVEEGEWLTEILQTAFGRLGRPALTPLRALLSDRGRDIWTRGRAADGLKELARYHPELRGEVIAALTAHLDAAEAEPSAETLNALVVSTLLDLEAEEEAAPAMRRAFAEDRVDQRIVGPESVPGAADLPVARATPRLAPDGSLTLWLRCTACGYERPHHVAKVYCDLTTLEQRKRGEETPYSEFVIPQRITCPKCGAVDQYELTGDALLTLTAALVTMMPSADSRRQTAPDSEGPLVFRHFTVQGRAMHPYAGRELYQHQVAAEPQRADLRVGYGSLLHFLGDPAEAALQYQTAVQLDPTTTEAYLNLGILAREDGDQQEARHLFERVVETAPRSTLSRQQREDFVRCAREELAELAGRARPESGALRRGGGPAMAPHSEVHEPARPPRAVSSGHGKVGRNDPCPCGSGMKYKKCCGR